MTISKDEFEIHGLDACKWVIHFNGMMLPGIVFGSRMEAEIGIDAKIVNWNKINQAATEIASLCDGSGEMSY